MFGYLTRNEMLAVIGTPDGTWISQRDHVLFLMLYNAGARVSEITAVTRLAHQLPEVALIMQRSEFLPGAANERYRRSDRPLSIIGSFA